MTGLKNFIGAERFTIRRRLGVGSFGTVYEVFDQEKNSVVALKVLHPTLFQESAEALFRFKREFRALADVTHPNLVSLYELISDGEQWFFTMELVVGINFLDYIREVATSTNDSIFDSKSVSKSDSKSEKISYTDAPTIDNSTTSIDRTIDTNVDTTTEHANNDTIINDSVTTSNETSSTPSTSNNNNDNNFTLSDAKRLRPLLRQLVEGVFALHRAGKLHRDLKPSNVLVTRQGRVVILDFGLVADLSANVNIDSSLGFLGTPSHMSPEQAACLPASEASDWYSVGVILYQALTGKLPFTGKMHEIISQRLEADPPPPISISPNIPSDLNNLCVSLLQREPNKRPTGKEILSRLRGVTSELPAASTLSHIFSSTSPNIIPLIGRESQLATLKTAFNESQKGQPTLVYLHASSGIGKSALVREFLAQLQTQQTVILSGRCYEQEAVPYKAVDNLIDTLSQYLKNLPLLESEVLIPRDVLVLARLFPVLGQVETIARARRKVLEIPDSQELRRRAFAALRELLGRLADRKPLVLFIDDLQWGDLDSVSLLEDILQPPDPPPLLLIVSYRTDEAESSLAVRELLKLREQNNSFIKFTEISLPELSVEELQKLALSLLGTRYQPTSQDLEIIAQEASGSPFFVSELIRYFQSTNYDIKRFTSGQTSYLDNAKPNKTGDLTRIMSLDKMLSVRISELPSNVRSLLEVIAVAGRPLDWAIAKKVVKLETDEPIILIGLRAQHLIRVREVGKQEKVETYHDRIRENIVANLPAEKLKQYHLALAEVLETTSQADPEILATHFLSAEKFEKAAQYTLLAAEKAYQLLAFDQAARFYELTIGLEPTQNSKNKELWEKLGVALANSGQSSEAAKAFLTASQLEQDKATIIQLQRNAAEKFLISGHMDEGLEVLRSFLDRVGLTLPASPKRALISFLYKRAQIWWRGLKFQERTESDIALEELMRIDTCWAGSIGLGIVDTTLGADFQARHLLLALNAGEPYRIVRALAMEAGYCSTSGGPNRARTEELLQAALELATRINQPHAIGLTKVMAGLAAFLFGEWKKSCDLLLSADEILQEHCISATWEINTSFFFRFRALYWLGELNLLANSLHTQFKTANDRGDLLAAVNLHTRTAYIIDLANDDATRAEIGVAKALSQWSSKYFHIQHYQGWVAQVEIALYKNNPTEAWQIFNEKWTQITNSLFLRIQHLLIETLHLHARAALALAEIEENATNFNNYLAVAEQKVKQLDQEKMSYATALATQIRATIYFLKGSKHQALQLLQQAENLFQLEGMILYQCAIKYFRGKLTNDSNLITNATSWMASQKIKNFEKFAKMLVPGLK